MASSSQLSVYNSAKFVVLMVAAGLKPVLFAPSGANAPMSLAPQLGTELDYDIYRD